MRVGGVPGAVVAAEGEQRGAPPHGHHARALRRERGARAHLRRGGPLELAGGGLHAQRYGVAAPAARAAAAGDEPRLAHHRARRAGARHRRHARGLELAPGHGHGVQREKLAGNLAGAARADAAEHVHVRHRARPAAKARRDVPRARRRRGARRARRDPASGGQVDDVHVVQQAPAPVLSAEHHDLRARLAAHERRGVPAPRGRRGPAQIQASPLARLRVQRPRVQLD